MLVSRIVESMDTENVLSIPLGDICLDALKSSVTLDINDSLLVAVNLLASKSARLLITEDGNPTGIIT